MIVGRLVPVKRVVHRKGKVFTQTFYVNPEEKVSEKPSQPIEKFLEPLTIKIMPGIQVSGKIKLGEFEFKNRTFHVHIGVDKVVGGATINLKKVMVTPTNSGVPVYERFIAENMLDMPLNDFISEIKQNFELAVRQSPSMVWTSIPGQSIGSVQLSDLYIPPSIYSFVDKYGLTLKRFLVLGWIQKNFIYDDQIKPFLEKYKNYILDFVRKDIPMNVIKESEKYAKGLSKDPETIIKIASWLSVTSKNIDQLNVLTKLLDKVPESVRLDTIQGFIDEWITYFPSVECELRFPGMVYSSDKYGNLTFSDIVSLGRWTSGNFTTVRKEVKDLDNGKIKQPKDRLTRFILEKAVDQPFEMLFRGSYNQKYLNLKVGDTLDFGVVSTSRSAERAGAFSSGVLFVLQPKEGERLKGIVIGEMHEILSEIANIHPEMYDIGSDVGRFLMEKEVIVRAKKGTVRQVIGRSEPEWNTFFKKIKTLPYPSIDKLVFLEVSND